MKYLDTSIEKIFYLNKKVLRGYYQGILFFGREKEDEIVLNPKFFYHCYDNQIPAQSKWRAAKRIRKDEEIYLYKEKGYYTKIIWRDDYDKIFIDLKKEGESAFLGSEIEIQRNLENKNFIIKIKNPENSNLITGESYDLILKVFKNGAEATEQFKIKIIEEVIP